MPEIAQARCTGCTAAGLFIRNTKGRCMFCGSPIEALQAMELPAMIHVDKQPFYGTQSINLQVHDRRQATMVTVPIVWTGDEYTASLPGGIGIRLGPVFEFENAEKLIRREVNREANE